MRKLRNEVVKKLQKADMTSAEIDFLLYISMFQEENGNVTGIHHRDICDGIHISEPKFYEILRSLEHKEIITYRKEDYRHYEVTILDNDFSGGDYKGYIKTNYKVLHSKKFRKLKAKEKLMFLDFLMSWGNDHLKSNHIGAENLISKYSKMYKVSRRSIRSYIKTLIKEDMYSIGDKGGMTYVRIRRDSSEIDNRESDEAVLNAHRTRKMIRASHIKCEDRNAVKEVSGLLTQYKNRAAAELLMEWLHECIEDSIRKKNSGVKRKKLWDMTLEAPFVHMLFKNKIEEYAM